MRQILPSKHTPFSRSLLGQGTLVLGVLGDAQISAGVLFALCREQHREQLDYPTFVLVLDFLYTIGVIDLDGQVIRKASRSAA